jgi:hypothetical protein
LTTVTTSGTGIFLQPVGSGSGQIYYGSGSAGGLGAVQMKHINRNDTIIGTFSNDLNQGINIVKYNSSDYVELGDSYHEVLGAWVHGGTIGLLATSATTPDTGISRLGAASLAVGNGAKGDITGNLTLSSINVSGSATGVAIYMGAGASFRDNSGSPSSSDSFYFDLPTIIFRDPSNSYSTSATITKNGIQCTYITLPGTGLLVQLGPYGNNGFYYQNSAGALDFGIQIIASSAGVNGYDLTGEVFASSSIISWGSSTSLASGSKDTSLSRINAGIVGVGTGAQGSIAGNIQCSSIALNGAVASPTAGIYYSGTNAGITQSAIAVGTLGTTGGIVTTFTGVSDERLKKFTEWGGGLAEILNIVPIRYRWNEAGQKKSGQTGDRDYVGFSAQNVQKSIPESIQGTEGEEQYLSFDDRPVIAALVNAVKELKAEIEVLKARK